MAKDRKKKINTVIAPLTPKQLNREIGAETRMKYGELGRDLQGDIRASNTDIRNTNSWFKQYQNRMNPVRDEQAASTANLQRDMRDNASYLSGWNRDQSDATGAAEDRSAAIRGAVADPTAASRDEAADTQRQALLASSRDRAAQIGASTGGFLRGVTAASELGRQADVRGIRNTIVETRSKQRDLKREKGDFRVARTGEKRGEEREWASLNRTFRAGRADSAADRALDAQELALARQKENRIASGGGSKGSRAEDKKERREDRREARQERRQAIQEGMAAIRLQIANGDPPSKARKVLSDPNYLYNWLVDKKGLDPAVARAVRNRWLVKSGNVADSLF
jgi:hypothetical protein